MKRFIVTAKFGVKAESAHDAQRAASRDLADMVDEHYEDATILEVVEDTSFVDPDEEDSEECDECGEPTDCCDCDLNCNDCGDDPCSCDDEED